jgi:hypothetical protein
LFTDWLAKSEANDEEKFHFSGIAEVKEKIAAYLEKYKIFGQDERDELNNCLNSKWEN